MKMKTLNIFNNLQQAKTMKLGYFISGLQIQDTVVFGFNRCEAALFNEKCTKQQTNTDLTFAR